MTQHRQAWDNTLSRTATELAAPSAAAAAAADPLQAQATRLSQAVSAFRVR